MSENKLKDYAVKIKENKRNLVINQINELHDSLVNIGLAKLPESIFVEYFLQHFMSGGGDINNALNIKWIELSGSPYNEVEIINEKGEVIYNIPPIIDKPVIDTSVEDINFTQIAATYNLKSNNMPAQGINYLNNKINTLDSKVTGNNNIIYAQRWFAIFNRYQTKNDTKITQPILNKSNIDDYINYD